MKQLRFLGRTAMTCLIGLSAIFVQAQTAPDIAKGMESEAVIRSYGWPKGRSATDGREIWMYDGFQVIFERGRVLSVTPLPLTKGQPTQRLTPPVRSAPPPPASSPPIVLRALPRPPVAPSNSRTNPVQPAPLNLAPAREPEAQVASQPPSGLRVGTLLLLLVAVATVVAVVKAVRKERERAVMEAVARSSATPSVVEKNWDETLAERLGRFHGTPPPVLTSATGPSAPVSILTFELLDRLEWRRFELLVSLYHGETGARPESCGFGPDGGVDIQLFRPGEARPYSYVQCKAWKPDVGVSQVRELFGVMSADKVPEGVLVTTAGYSNDARAFAAANNIVAIDGRGFVERFNQLNPDARTKILAEVMEGDYTTPTCASCGIKMVLRDGERPFWGCTNFPRCTNKMNPRKSREN